MNLSSAVFFLAGFFLVIVAAKTTQSDVSKPSQGSVNDGKIVMHQLCNSGMAKAEVSSLKKEVEMLRKVLTQRLDKNGTKGKWEILLVNLCVIFASVFFFY